MPETPDFEKIARAICQRIWGNDVLESMEPVVLTIAEQLRQVWNARGAADLAATEGVIDQSAHRDALLILLYGNGPGNPLTAAIARCGR